MKKVLEYFKGVISEIRKINWPTKKNVARLTFYVLTASFCLGAFIALFDFLFTELVARIIKLG